MKTCENCGAEFTPNKKTPYQRMCSKKCRKAVSNRNELAKKRLLRSVLSNTTFECPWAAGLIRDVALFKPWNYCPLETHSSTYEGGLI